jgi:hypothetical protein
MHQNPEIMRIPSVAMYRYLYEHNIYIIQKRRLGGETIHLFLLPWYILKNI